MNTVHRYLSLIKDFHPELNVETRPKSKERKKAPKKRKR